MCQASLCGFSHAAGRYGDARIGSKSLWARLKGAVASPGFPGPDLADQFPIKASVTSSHIDRGRDWRVSLLRDRLGVLVILVLRQHRPDRTGHSICQGDRRHEFWFPSQKPFKPRALLDAKTGRC